MSKPVSRAQRRSARVEKLLAAFHEEATPGASGAVDVQMLRDLLPYARPELVRFLVAFALMPLIAAVTVYQPRLLQQAVDAVGHPQGAQVLRSVSLQFALLITARFVLQFVQTYTVQLAGQRTVAALRSRVFEHLQQLSIRYFDRTPVGRLVTRVTNDLDSLGELFASGAITALGDIFLLLGVVASMLAIDWRLSLIAFAVLPPMGACVEVCRRLLRKAHRRIRARVAQLNAMLNEQVQGVHVVNAFGQERECGETYAAVNAAYRDANLAQIRYDASLYSVVEGVSSVCVGLVLWYAAERIGVLGEGQMAEAYKGTFVAFYAYIQQFFVPVRDLSTKYTAIQSALASAERVFGLLAVKEFDAPIVAGDGAVVAVPEETGSSPAIEFEDVTFAYKDDTVVLQGVSFQVPRGHTVALVGATGAGKSTVTALTQRFYDVTQGQVRVLGHDVRRYPREVLRRQFAMVQQDVFLFTGTVLDNVAFGDLDPDPARAEQALHGVGAWDFIEARGGLQTEVAERGANLSLGERQLIAFARALYRDPPILMLDEATANIDGETEARLQRAVDVVLDNRTAVVIAHRLSTIRRANRILVFHKGKLVEQGTHEDLVAQAGIYARLVKLQMVERAGSQRSEKSVPGS